MADENLFPRLKTFLVQRGATSVACGDLSTVPAELRDRLPIGVSIGAALAPSVVAEIVDGPTPAYATEYQRVNALLERLAADGAALLSEQGFRAAPQKVTVDKLDETSLCTPLPHKTVATRAGVGWIGKCALLVTEAYGSAVRYNTVLTDAPLPVATPTESSRCGQCDACVDVCPAGALSGRDWHLGRKRDDLVDALACCQTAKRLARGLGESHVICGICIAACPYTERYLAQSGHPPKRDGGPP